MIKILDRYLWVHILAGTLLVLLVLVSLDVFFTFMNEIGDVGRGRYGYLQALSYVLLSLPQRLYEYAPTATLIGSLLSLGSLAAHQRVDLGSGSHGQSALLQPHHSAAGAGAHLLDGYGSAPRLAQDLEGALLQELPLASRRAGGSRGAPRGCRS
ncbi:MAG TPA: LptF/LptG family permease, partial [Thiotrichales bacterium]|nr:LptF/LptG family permease [Thiotrichales bacterium]